MFHAFVFKIALFGIDTLHGSGCRQLEDILVLPAEMQVCWEIECKIMSLYV